jgi:hypothetical protein
MRLGPLITPANVVLINTDAEYPQLLFPNNFPLLSDTSSMLQTRLLSAVYRLAALRGTLRNL